MGWMFWIDPAMFLILFCLFFYVFSSNSITVLHRIYLLLHIVFMIWPIFQFVAQTASNTEYQLLFLSISYVGLSLLGIGWFVLTLFFTGQSYVIRKSRLFMLAIPALASVAAIVFNPDGMFLSINDTIASGKQLQHGPLYWVMIGQLLLYVAVSFIIMIYKLRTDESKRHRTLVRTVLIGLMTHLLFSLADLVVNVLFIDYVYRYIPLISVGMTLTAIYLVHAIGRNKVLDIIQIAQRDVMNTMSTGIIVLDEFDTIIEVNKVIKPIIRLRIGDKLDTAMIALTFKDEAAKDFEAFFNEVRNRPMDRVEFELELKNDRFRHIIIQSAPILDQKKAAIGRVLTFQDVTELRLLVEETNRQNVQLHDRNRDLMLMQDELSQANKKLEQMAITDGLTGCYNRRYLLLQLEQEVMMNLKFGISFSIFLFDLDYFKLINDKYGHLVGDEVLCSTVNAVKGALRKTDILARYGGEEFTVYLPHTNREQADIIADLVKEAVESNRVQIGAGEPSISVTISMGVVSIEHFEPSVIDDPKAYLREILAQADAALYEAKYNGRNRIVKRKLA
ncbi:diguanylate cyclase (GGDEF)-like protein [Paenibacillus harenae]|uniref:Diguanylate cyclase (GGDEF)-like protein n=2 Tax=Paenibacillus harenae TaxID=306543 RepID=A0ABT9U7V5_PAEHA|nr:diguanylate cyclase (GGDEF)-like protein [Paenibacillus harenae]